jgi:8-oxo-dGTP pyrophosphatase MutT (NUDIX family)
MKPLTRLQSNGPPMTDPVRSLYRGRIVHLGLETVVLPGGRSIELEIVRHPGGAAVAAVDEKDRVCLVHQYRHAGGGWMWELPAGKIDNQEDPKSTARRELREEGGVEAQRWRSLGRMHSSPGVFDEVIHLFLAQGLTHTGQGLEEDEVLEVHWLDLNQALQWAVSGEITDAKTVVGLFRAAASLGG